MSKQLEADANKRALAQDEHLKLEQEVHDMTCRNLELK